VEVRTVRDFETLASGYPLTQRHISEKMNIYLHTYIHIYMYAHKVFIPSWNGNITNSWSRVLPEKLTSSQIIKKFPAFYGTRRFSTAFTRFCHLPQHEHIRTYIHTHTHTYIYIYVYSRTSRSPTREILLLQ
jgi:hypothetical protein